MSVRRAVPSVVIALATVGLLAACVGPVAVPTPSDTAVPTPTDTQGTTDLADDVAFVVSGVLASPEGDLEVGFSMTVGYPTLDSADEDAATFAASTWCPPDMVGEYLPALTDPVYVHVDVETRLVSGTLADAYVVPLTADYISTWSGDVAPFQAACSTPVLQPVPGSASMVGFVEAGVDVGDGTRYGWLPNVGGFGLAVERPMDDGGEVVTFTATECSIEFGPNVSGTAAADLRRVDAAFGCSFGLADHP